MYKKQFFSQEIPAQTLERVMANLQEVDSLLKSYLITLTKAERLSCTSMRNKSLAFVTHSYEYAKSQSHLVPTYVDMSEWETTMVFLSQLQTMQNTLESIQERCLDSRLAAGHEAYQASLLFYGGLKEQSRGNVGVAKVARNELKQQFRSKKQILADNATTTI